MFIVGNAQHIGARESQQDFFGFSDAADLEFAGHGGMVAVVADGMGGLAHGEEAAKWAVRAFLTAYAAKRPAETIPEALDRSIRAANTKVFEVAQELRVPGNMGSTMIAVAFRMPEMHWVSVGDSGLFLLRDKELTKVNASHTYAAILDARVARGEISADQAAAHPQRESLTSYIGSPVDPEIDRNHEPFPIRTGDLFVLASDGLFKTLPSDQVASVLRAERRRAADMLVRRTIQAGKEFQDNVTVVTVAIDLDGAGGKTAVAELPETAEMRKPVFVTEESAAPERSYSRLILCAALIAAALIAAYFFLGSAFSSPSNVTEESVVEIVDSAANFR